LSLYLESEEIGAWKITVVADKLQSLRDTNVLDSMLDNEPGYGWFDASGLI